MSRVIFLIGMPGAGKTTWGERVAEAFGLDWIDLDRYIELKEKKTVGELFLEFGEAGFRTREAIYLEEALGGDEAGLVLSCGGGTPLDPMNLQLMKSKGCIVYLKATTETLVHRLETAGEDRPLLAGTEQALEEKLDGLFAVRKQVYEQADFTLQSEYLTIKDFEPIIQQCIKQP